LKCFGVRCFTYHFHTCKTHTCMAQASKRPCPRFTADLPSWDQVVQGCARTGFRRPKGDQLISASKFFFGQVADFGLAAECKTDLQGVVGTSGSLVFVRMSAQQCGVLVCVAVIGCGTLLGSLWCTNERQTTGGYIALYGATGAAAQ